MDSLGGITLVEGDDFADSEVKFMDVERTGNGKFIVRTGGLPIKDDDDVFTVKPGLLAEGAAGSESFDTEDEAAPPKSWTAYIKPNCVVLATYHDLSDKLKAKLNQYILASLPQGIYDMNSVWHFPNNELSWAMVNKANYRDCMPAFYEQTHMVFTVWDMDFFPVASFVEKISTQALHALLFNGNINIHMCFSDDTVEPFMLEGLKDWLYLCQRTNRRVQLKPFNGVRIPWQYWADNEDMFAHIDSEARVYRWGKLSTDMENEWELIKAAFHVAPLRT